MQMTTKDLEALTTLLREFDPKRLTAEVVSLGEDWVDRDAAASSLEETKKTLLARLTLEYISGGSSGGVGEKPKAMPVSQAELKALSDPRYEQHLELMVAARQESNRMRVRYDLGKMRLELMRSLQATMRNEMRMAGQT
jgi:hypothetical protein